MDELLRTQFMFREDKTIYMQLLDHVVKNTKSLLSDECLQLDYKINKMVFSPLGSYLAVCGSEGIHLYVGADLKYKGFLKHFGAVDAKFSHD